MSVPEGWRNTRLDQHIVIKHGFPFSSAHYASEGKYVLLTPGSFYEEGGFRHQGEKTKYFCGHVSTEYILKKNDLLIAMTEQKTGLLGSAIFVPEHGVYLHNQRLGLVVSMEPSAIHRKFLYFWFNYEKTKLAISRESGGTKVKHTSPEKLCSLQILLPPLAEQKKIAAILSTWDKAIEATDKLLRNARQQKKALMQQLLTGKERLPGFGGEWESKQSRKVFKTVSARRQNNESLLAVTQDRGVLPRAMLERRVVMPEGSTAGYKLVVPGNFIISLRSFQGGIEYSSYRGLVSPAYTVLSATIIISDEFYKQYFKSHIFIGQLAVAVIGIRDGKQVSYDDFSFLKIPLPPLPEQQAIARVLTTADKEIDALTQKAALLRQEKRALMQQLLTGKKRVQVEA